MLSYKCSSTALKTCLSSRYFTSFYLNSLLTSLLLDLIRIKKL